jgi:hypothetical protein
VLEKEAWTRRFKPNENFLLFLLTSVIIVMPQSKAANRCPVKGMTKTLGRFLSQDRKIKPSSEHFGLTSDII